MAHLEDETGDIIAKARRGLAITIDSLSKASGVSAADIESIEAYKLQPTRDQAAQLAQALDLDADKLADIAEGVWEPKPAAVESEQLAVERVQVPYGSYGENCYITICSQTRAAAVVDPGGAVDEINLRLSDLGLNLNTVLITHAHPDHIGGLRQLVLDRADVQLVSSLVERESVTRGLKVKWEPAKDSMRIAIGSLNVIPLFIPGHTPGSTCYLINGVCFVGDTLFAGSIGRPASPQDYRLMLKEIRLKLFSLPDATILLPGHGPATTVGEEKAHNPFFR